MNFRQRIRNDERGFTLVELLMSISIGSIVVVAIAGAFITLIKTDTATSNRFNLSHDRQLANNYLTQDVQSAASVAIAPSASADGCYTGTSTAFVLNLQWTSPTISGPQKVVYAYEVVDGVGQLVRQACGPQNSTTVIARNLFERPVATKTSATPFSVTLALKDNASPPATYSLTATPRSSLRNPTTTAPGPATTVIAPTTTSTTVAPTTTSTTVPCTLTAKPTALPTSQKQDKNGKLPANFVVTVKVAGNCGALHVEYAATGNSTQSADLATTGAATQSAALSGNTKWDAGVHAIVVKTDSGNVLTPAGSNTLSVTVTS